MFSLTTNHVHLLIKVTEAGTISKVMQSITMAHIRYYNFKYQRTGHERICKYKDLFKVILNERHVDEIRKSTKKGVAYVSEKFKNQIARMLPMKRKSKHSVKTCLKEIVTTQVYRLCEEPIKIIKATWQSR